MTTNKDQDTADVTERVKALALRGWITWAEYFTLLADIAHGPEWVELVHGYLRRNFRYIDGR